MVKILRPFYLTMGANVAIFTTTSTEGITMLDKAYIKIRAQILGVVPTIRSMIDRGILSEPTINCRCTVPAKTFFENAIATHEENIKATAINFNKLNTYPFKKIIRTGRGYVVVEYEGKKLYVRVSSTELTVKTTIGSAVAELPLLVALALIKI